MCESDDSGKFGDIYNKLSDKGDNLETINFIFLPLHQNIFGHLYVLARKVCLLRRTYS